MQAQLTGAMTYTILRTIDPRERWRERQHPDPALPQTHAACVCKVPVFEFDFDDFQYAVGMPQDKNRATLATACRRNLREA